MVNASEYLNKQLKAINDTEVIKFLEIQARKIVFNTKDPQGGFNSYMSGTFSTRSLRTYGFNYSDPITITFEDDTNFTFPYYLYTVN